VRENIRNKDIKLVASVGTFICNRGFIFRKIAVIGAGTVIYMCSCIVEHGTSQSGFATIEEILYLL
jgi:hypothetical protein